MEEKQTELTQKIHEVKLEPDEYDENSKGDEDTGRDQIGKEEVKKSGKGLVAKFRRFKKKCSLKLGRS